LGTRLLARWQARLRKGFRSQFVESKGGGEAQNSKWYPLRDFEEGLVGGDWGFFCAIQTATHMLDLPGSSEVQEVRTSYGYSSQTFTLVDMCRGFDRNSIGTSLQ
jgi:hypothetical protein